MKKEEIDIALKPLANKCKKQKISKQLVINNVKELIRIIGYDIEFINPAVKWTANSYISSSGKETAWEEINEHSFANIQLTMNDIFIYGFGSNQKIK